MRWITSLLLVVGCGTDEAGDNAVDTDADAPVVPFVWADDCDEGSNENASNATLVPADEATYDAALCNNDKDVYRVDVPAGKWVSIEIQIDGTGKGKSDLDLFELEGPDTKINDYLDMSTESGKDDKVWESAVSEDYERLAWYNPYDEPVAKYVMVKGYKAKATDYTLVIRQEKWHDERDCDDAFNNSKETGPCNAIMQFPQANDVDEGYVVSHWPHYSNLRREVAYLIRFAAAETAATFENTKPLGLGDMGEDDGDTPGRMEGQLRHPEGTHTNGNDLDIAYYQNGTNNLLRPACPQNDGYFCTGEPTLLDARRTAFFMAKLASSPRIRVMGVDTKIAPKVLDAADELQDEGLLTRKEVEKLNTYITYGEGWPFHHHHIHFSWQWEDGWEFESGRAPEGCLGDAHLDMPDVLRQYHR
jgi:hypothetical protein